MSACSTTANLVTSDPLLESGTESWQIRRYVDLSKAFEAACHEPLIAKLTQMDVPCSITALLFNHLHNETSFVSYNGQSSIS